MQYSNAVKQAEAESEAEMIGCVREAARSGPQYWPAGMTYLERRHPDRWGKRERQDPPQHTTNVQINFVPFAGVAPLAPVKVISGPDVVEGTVSEVSDTKDLGHSPPRSCGSKDTGG